MGTERTEVVSHLSRVDELRKNIAKAGISDPTDMGKLFGISSSQYKSIGQLERILTSLTDDPNIQTGTDAKEIEAREFLIEQRGILNRYKDLLLTEIIKKEESRDIKKISETSALLPINIIKLQSAQSSIAIGFSAIQNSLSATISKINEEFEGDIKTQESRRELAFAFLKVAIGVVGAGALGEIVDQALRNLHNEEIEMLTGEAGHFSKDAILRAMARRAVEEAIDTATDQMLIEANKHVEGANSHISAKFQHQVTEFLTKLSLKSCEELTSALKRVGEIQLTQEDWDKELDAANKEQLLTSNPNEIEAIVANVQKTMQNKIVQAKEQHVNVEYNKLSRPIKKIIELTGIQPEENFDKMFQQKMDPIDEYFKIHLIVSVLSREYRTPSAKAHGYKEVSEPTDPTDISQYEGFKPLIRKGQVKHFPVALTHIPKIIMMLEPRVLTGKIERDKSMHKGGSKLRRFLANKLSGMSANEELYGFKKPLKESRKDAGKIAKHKKGTLEDALRSYSIIATVLEGTRHSKHTSAIPSFKEDKEILHALKTIMEINVFFNPHPDNKQFPLITPLCVFNRDPYFMDLLKQSEPLQKDLAKLMTTKGFILKCLTDPNISAKKPDEKRLKSTLVELMSLLKSIDPKVDQTKISELNKEAEDYIKCQCAKASILTPMKKSQQAADLIIKEFLAVHDHLEKHPKDKTSKRLIDKYEFFGDLIVKLSRNPESVSSQELDMMNEHLSGIRFSSEKSNTHLRAWIQQFKDLSIEKKSLEKAQALQLDTLQGLGMARKPHQPGDTVVSQSSPSSSLDDYPIRATGSLYPESERASDDSPGSLHDTMTPVSTAIETEPADSQTIKADTHQQDTEMGSVSRSSPDVPKKATNDIPTKPDIPSDPNPTGKRWQSTKDNDEADSRSFSDSPISATITPSPTPETKKLERTTSAPIIKSTTEPELTPESKTLLRSFSNSPPSTKADASSKEGEKISRPIALRSKRNPSKHSEKATRIFRETVSRHREADIDTPPIDPKKTP